MSMDSTWLPKPASTELLTTARETLGLEHVPIIHANDAKAAMPFSLDRHANIGAGYIGLEGFRRILNHPDLREKAFILETPDECRAVIFTTLRHSRS